MEPGVITSARSCTARFELAAAELTIGAASIARKKLPRLPAGLSSREAFRVFDMLQKNAKNADRLPKEP